jgi:hypothetical protein
LLCAFACARSAAVSPQYADVLIADMEKVIAAAAAIDINLTDFFIKVTSFLDLV